MTETKEQKVLDLITDLIADLRIDDPFQRQLTISQLLQIKVSEEEYAFDLKIAESAYNKVMLKDKRKQQTVTRHRMCRFCKEETAQKNTYNMDNDLGIGFYCNCLHFCVKCGGKNVHFTRRERGWIDQDIVDKLLNREADPISERLIPLGSDPRRGLK